MRKYIININVLDDSVELTTKEFKDEDEVTKFFEESFNDFFNNPLILSEKQFYSLKAKMFKWKL